MPFMERQVTMKWKHIALLCAPLVIQSMSGCGTSDTEDDNPCPAGQPQNCFGAAANTCYCGDSPDTRTYCRALLNEDPTNPVSTCAPYRGEGASCQSDADCLAASGCDSSPLPGGCPLQYALVCHTANDAYVFSCVHPCSTDAECPEGESCDTDYGLCS
jgi:Cys-rich repeat protein